MNLKKNGNFKKIDDFLAQGPHAAHICRNFFGDQFRIDHLHPTFQRNIPNF